MASITLKDLPDDLMVNMRKRADVEGRSMQEMVRRLLGETYGDTPPSVWGYIKIDRVGDIDLGEDCPACGEPAQSWWLQITNTGEQHIMCGSCATSE